MARQYISMENLRFLLYEVHEIDKLTAYERYSHVGGKEEIDLLINAAKEIADREMFPFFKEMDTIPVVHKDGKVHSHPQLKIYLKQLAMLAGLVPYQNWKMAECNCPSRFIRQLI